MATGSRGLVWAALAMFAVSPAALRAQSGGDPAQGCAAIVKRSARLACYDDAARRGIPSSPVPRRQAGKGRPIAEGLGSEQVRDRRPQAERPVEQTRELARVASVSDNGTGHWRVALTDGAIWQMTIADPHFHPPEAGEVVRIRRGAVGGYLMDVGRQTTVNVARVQ